MSREGQSADATTIEESLRIVHACRDGHQGAWHELFVSHLGYVRRIASRLGIPSSELDDVCQEVFLVVFRKLSQFDHGKFTTWLYRITANVVSDHHRKRRTRAHYMRRLFLQREDAHNPTPEQVVAIRRRMHHVEKILAEMAPKKREVFALYELEGLSGDQIAELVGCNVGTVRARLMHARRDFARIARKKGLVRKDVP